MARILEHGNRHVRKTPRSGKAGSRKTFLCTACWCRFEAGPKEYHATGTTNPFTKEDIPGCPCPECGRDAVFLDVR